MQHSYSWKRLLLSGLLALGITSIHARAAPPDSTASAPRFSSWVLKGGLHLSHFSYRSSSSSWQVLVPASLGIERRLGSRFSLYAQLEPSMQLTSVSAARRRRHSSLGADAALSATNVALGGRCYYSRPAHAAHASGSPEFGRYVAVELGAEAAQASTRLTSASRPGTTTRSFVGNRQVLTPSLYALWGIQNRLRSHVLYDLSAGLGIVAPTRTDAEYFLPSHGWDVGAQVNVRLYWSN